MPTAGWFSIGASSSLIAPAPRPLNWKRYQSRALPGPYKYDMLLVCQYPHALSRERLVPALAGRTNAA